MIRTDTRRARYNHTPENGVCSRKKGLIAPLASPLKGARGNERVEDGSWHNDEEETNVARGAEKGRENPREGTGKEGRGGRQSHGLNREGMLREDECVRERVVWIGLRPRVALRVVERDSRREGERRE